MAGSKISDRGRAGSAAPAVRRGTAGEAVDRLCAAALACYERYGAVQTSVEEIAQEAGVSRQAIYYHFASKEDILFEVAARQVSASFLEITRELRRFQGMSRVVEAALLSIEMAERNQYMRVFLAPETDRVLDKILLSEPVREVLQSFWYPILEEARRCGEVRVDVGSEELLAWILLVQRMIVTHGKPFGFGGAAVRRKLELFLVPSLQSESVHPSRDGAASGQSVPRSRLHAQSRRPKRQPTDEESQG